MPQYKERLYIINTPGWKITNCSRQQSRPPHTRSDARGRTDEKFAPFALSRNSSSATYSCLWCLRWKTLDNTLNCYPYLKRPILHIKAVPKAIRERLSNKSIFLQHFLYWWVTHGNKGGLNLETSLCEQHPGRKKAFTNIRYVLLLLYLPSPRKKSIHRGSGSN